MDPAPPPPPATAGAVPRSWPRRIFGTVVFDFGGVVVFYLLLWTLGLRAAIAGTILFVPVDAVRRRALGIGFPRLYILSTAMVLVFGTVDVFSRRPFMLRYEGAVTECILAIAFFIGSRDRSILEELLAQQQPTLRLPYHRRYLQLITRSWSVYYLLMAAFFLFVGQHFSYVRAIGIRQVSGLVGAFAMALFSFSGGFALNVFRALDLLPREPDPEFEATDRPAAG